MILPIQLNCRCGMLFNAHETLEEIKSSKKILRKISIRVVLHIQRLITRLFCWFRPWCAGRRTCSEKFTSIALKLVPLSKRLRNSVALSWVSWIGSDLLCQGYTVDLLACMRVSFFFPKDPAGQIPALIDKKKAEFRRQRCPFYKPAPAKPETGRSIRKVPHQSKTKGS